jgi:hypothetical protein
MTHLELLDCTIQFPLDAVKLLSDIIDVYGARDRGYCTIGEGSQFLQAPERR